MKMREMKLETHAHTSEVSGCGKLPAETIARMYAAVGYRVMIVTDHMCAGRDAEKPLQERVEHYLSGFRAARRAGDDLGLHVLLGAETRIRGGEAPFSDGERPSGNEDFLVLGLREEQTPALMALTDTATSFEEYVRAVHAMGLLVIQAHPFRQGLVAMPTVLLDGVEVYNGNPRHDSHNDKALAHACAGTGMIMLSGSDAHQREDVGRGGIFVPENVVDNPSLLEYLKAHREPARIETNP